MSLSARDLLKSRRFLPLFLTQFFGAFNDNAFKLASVTMISYHLTSSQAASEHYQAIASALFILPFFLFSATSGQLADLYDKTYIARGVKVLEVVLMCIGSYALAQGYIFGLMFVLFGMGTHSTFFGPVKYAILPDHLPKNALLGATGLIEASTFMAILLGTTLGTLVISSHSSQIYGAAFLTISVAIFGLISSLFIPKAPSSSIGERIDWLPWRATWNMMRQIFDSPSLLLAILAISWFWLIGAVLLTKLPDYTHFVLRAGTTVFAFFLALFSIGIACGSLTVNRLLKGQLSLRFVPMAMMLLSIFMFDLFLASPNDTLKENESLTGFVAFLSYSMHWRIMIDLFMLSFSAGLFVVPLYTYLQVMSDDDRRARTIATNNIYNALFMVLGSLLIMLMLYLKTSIPEVFLIMSIANFCIAIFIWVLIKLGIMR